jgi:type I restriction enzyme S subunit
MSEWKKVKLGEITESCLGKMLDAAKNRGEYKPYLANLNVRWGSFDTENLSLMKFEEDEDERYGIKYGDLIICEGGEPGRCAIWKEQIPDMKIQKALHRVRPKAGLVNNFYLFYWFLLAGKRNWIDQYCTGATIKHLPGQKLKEVIVDVPSLSTQHRIVAILSRYDSLIENYQKQIKLLEEAAQRLYKEWFVDLHFPGHENTKIVDGVPEGWEKKTLGELISYVRGKSYSSNEISDEGCIMVNLKNIQAFGGYKRDAEKRFIGEYKPEQTLQKGDLVMGVTDMTQERRLVGHVALIPDFNEPATFSMDLIKIIPYSVPIIYLYCAMRYGGISKQISPLANGVNVLHLKPDTIMGTMMVVPRKDLIERFCPFVEEMTNKIRKNQSQIRLLTEARDRLLPKLMSGEI